MPHDMPSTTLCSTVNQCALKFTAKGSGQRASVPGIPHTPRNWAQSIIQKKSSHEVHQGDMAASVTRGAGLRCFPLG